MKCIREIYTSRIEIKKSKFICLFIPLQDEKLVSDRISDIKKEYPKATHYCYAYRINKKEKSQDIVAALHFSESSNKICL